MVTPTAGAPDLGFYDLRLAETRAAQADSGARVTDGRLLLLPLLVQRPANSRSAPCRQCSLLDSSFSFLLVLGQRELDAPWDGGERTILLEQTYSAADDIAHIRALLAAFADERYNPHKRTPGLSGVSNRSHAGALRTAERWREEVARAGLGDLFLVGVEGFQGELEPAKIGFDASVDSRLGGGN